MKVKDLAQFEGESFYKYEKYFNIYENKEGMYFLNLIKPFNVETPTIFNKLIEKIHIFSPTDNFYYISNLYYKTIDLWWFICIYNKIDNPLQKPEIGSKIRILDIQYVNNILNKTLTN